MTISGNAVSRIIATARREAGSIWINSRPRSSSEASNRKPAFGPESTRAGFAPSFAYGAAAIGALVATWFVATALPGVVSNKVLPSPIDVVARFVTLTLETFSGSTLFGHAVASLTRWVIGVGAAVALLAAAFVLYPVYYLFQAAFDVGDPNVRPPEAYGLDNFALLPNYSEIMLNTLGVAVAATVMALVFGFVHGFGFANALDGIDASGVTLLPLLAGFNIGVELAQLGIVAVVLPAIYSMRATRWYSGGVLPLGSCVLGAAGLVWMSQRI